ncbi:NAD(P)H-dependent oxidoreductase [Rariglobus hedericola]|uniref:NAD(P)H-dependent oxidoreductase n=1 Tax=Rariglobus hedericola TaxID=2597822 RepID=A0A556QJP9_9BACT|nr:NAD(P)H-dependent oxidoreductase [Rariglobus hedericola]TSJ76858.1 NAD(P)H-dependent oxidoreductase [Rariglobus hedericola]
MNILIINAHLTYPGWSEGKLNNSLAELAKTFFIERGHTVTETKIERGYDPDTEVAKHATTDLVILQTPVNWFGAPWIYKKYVDEVFNAGGIGTKILLEDDGRTRSDPTRQYGTGGKMQGKRFMVSATWNAPHEAFDNPHGILYGGKGTADVFLNITSSYKFCGYDVLPDFNVFDIFKKIEAIPASFEDYKRHLETHCL